MGTRFNRQRTSVAVIDRLKSRVRINSFGFVDPVGDGRIGEIILAIPERLVCIDERRRYNRRRLRWGSIHDWVLLK